MATSRRRSASSGGSQPGIEWVGGVKKAPFLVADGDGSVRPDLVLWLELPSGALVGHTVVADAEREGSLGRTLEVAFAEPLMGPPRKPSTIRVADLALAHQVLEIVGDAIPVRVGPTPEVDAVVGQFEEHVKGGRRELSYLERGQIPTERVRRLFEAVQPLWAAAPWRVADDDHVLRMDIPALGVEGACVSIIGKLGQNRGLVIFPSLAGYDAFVTASDAPQSARRGGGTSYIGLTFERREDLPSTAQQEVERYGWPVIADDAYPWIHGLERDGGVKSVTERDVAIVAACAEALAAFYIRNSGVFTDLVREAVCESCFDRNDLEVRFTRPYEAAPSFEASIAAAASDEGARSKVGRNEPCPCGSGKKFKKCHGVRSETEGAGHPLHVMDRGLATAIVRDAERHTPAALAEAIRSFPDPEALGELGLVWIAYTQPLGDATPADRFLAKSGARLTTEERSWIAAQQSAWLSVWEVLEVERGKGLVLHDLLSGQRREVQEVSATATLNVREAVLARVVDHDGFSLLCGMHPRGLPPREAAEVVRRVRGRLLKQRDVPIERLRDPAIGRYLVERWGEGLDACATRAANLTLTNTDGDPLLLTVDHFRLVPGARAAVAERLPTLERARVEKVAGRTSWIFVREGSADSEEGSTVIGRADLEADALRVETNSRRRADALRARIEEACGDLLRHRAREHTDPLSERLPPVAKDLSIDESPELAAAALAYKERHYATWCDIPLPALGGLTPRAAVATARGRTAVDVLLKEMERGESREAPGSAYSFAAIRRELRLDWAQ